MKGSNYIIITSSSRISHHLQQEGVDSICLDFSNEAALESIEKALQSNVAIIIAANQESVRQVGQKLVRSGAKVRCYATDVRDRDVLNEPLSSFIGSEDADKIERIAGSFILKPFGL